MNYKQVTVNVLILGCVLAGFPRNSVEGRHKNKGNVPEVPQKIDVSRNLPSNPRPLYDTPTKYSE